MATRQKKEIAEDSQSDIDMSGVPEPLDGLSRRQKKVWDRLTRALARHGMINETDFAMLHLICTAFTDWMDAQFEKDSFKDGNNGSVMTILPNGYSKVHELEKVCSERRDEFYRYLKEAGLTHKSFVELMKMRRDTEAAERMASDPLNDFMSKRPGVQ